MEPHIGPSLKGNDPAPRNLLKAHPCCAGVPVPRELAFVGAGGVLRLRSYLATFWLNSRLRLDLINRPLAVLDPGQPWEPTRAQC